MSSMQEQERLCYSLYLYQLEVELGEAMRPAAEPNLKEDAGNALRVLVLMAREQEQEELC